MPDADTLSDAAHVYLDHERDIIGAALLDPNSVRDAINHITPDDFGNVALGRVFSLIVGLRGAGLPIGPLTIADAARERGVRGVDPVRLFEIQAATATSSNVDYLARRVAEAAVRRRLASFGLRAHQLASYDDPIDDVLGMVRDEYATIRGTVSSGMAFRTLGDILEAEDEYDWLIPGLFERGDRLVLTGGEGAGKTTLVRQIVVCLAAGLHPFTHEAVDPIRVLVVDPENSERQWKRQTKGLALKAKIRSPHPFQTNIRIANTPRLDIVSDKTLNDIHAAIDEHDPAIVAIGPLYKLTPRGLNEETDAAKVITALDSIRDRGVALLMEAHAGHGKTGMGDRDLRPRGSSSLLGWPEFGFGLQLDPGDPEGRTANLVRWRGDREERDWPQTLLRGGDWPWTDQRQAPGRGAWQPHPTEGDAA